MAKYITWYAEYDGPRLEIVEASSLEEAFEKEFGEKFEQTEFGAMYRDELDGIESLVNGDHTISRFETPEEKESLVKHLIEFLDEEPLDDLAYDLPEEVLDELSKEKTE